MELKTLNRMVNDKHFFDLKKMGHKYGKENLDEMIALLETLAYAPIGLKDFKGNNCVYLPSHVKTPLTLTRKMVASFPPELDGEPGHHFRQKAMEEEIGSSLKIEKIDGKANKKAAFDMQKGLDFISDPKNVINQENLYQLYDLAISSQLDEASKLPQGHKYRNDRVYVVGKEVYHQGLYWEDLAEYMDQLMVFINSLDNENSFPDLVKASIIHFYLAYLHPYFDGNGRMARFIHLWFLVQKDYPTALLYSLSRQVEKSVKEYYKSFVTINENAEISGLTDLTPFINYFNVHVYKEIERLIDEDLAQQKTWTKQDKGLNELFQAKLAQGLITQKEEALWEFVTAVYGKEEFSTKMLEKDFGQVAYATVRSFVLKFEGLGLLGVRKYSNRNRYYVNTK